jgi:hypothetical protein
MLIICDKQKKRAAKEEARLMEERFKESAHAYSEHAAMAKKQRQAAEKMNEFITPGGGMQNIKLVVIVCTPTAK